MKFAFIIPSTPYELRTRLRSVLWRICRQALIAQQEQDWKAYIVGSTDEDLRDPRFEYLGQDKMPKGEKIELALKHILANNSYPEYIIRLDDDDVISSTYLQTIKLEDNMDCWVDRNHTFYEISSGKISQQERPWFPNTIVHKFSHAIERIECEGRVNYLLCHNHSIAWHMYYANKNCTVEYSKKNEPIYMRILSPFSITSMATKEADRVKAYQEYLLSFGAWNIKYDSLTGFEGSQIPLNHIMASLKEYDLFDIKLPGWALFKNRIAEFKRGLY